MGEELVARTVNERGQFKAWINVSQAADFHRGGIGVDHETVGSDGEDGNGQGSNRFGKKQCSIHGNGSGSDRPPAGT